MKLQRLRFHPPSVQHPVPLFWPLAPHPRHRDATGFRLGIRHHSTEVYDTIQRVRFLDSKRFAELVRQRLVAHERLVVRYQVRAVDAHPPLQPRTPPHDGPVPGADVCLVHRRLQVREQRPGQELPRQRPTRPVRRLPRPPQRLRRRRRVHRSLPMDAHPSICFLVVLYRLLRRIRREIVQMVHKPEGSEHHEADRGGEHDIDQQNVAEKSREGIRPVPGAVEEVRDDTGAPFRERGGRLLEETGARRAAARRDAGGRRAAAPLLGRMAAGGGDDGWRPAVGGNAAAVAGGGWMTVGHGWDSCFARWRNDGPMS